MHLLKEGRGLWSDSHFKVPGWVIARGDLLVGLGAFSLSLKALTMDGGKVWPFSQISTSFLIFSYEQPSL